MDRLDKRNQFRRFFAALFQPDELVEFRFIETWTKAGKRKSRVVCPARWVRAGQVTDKFYDLVQLAASERANVYFGVCPRPRVGDATDETIRTIRCFWADMDDITIGEAWRRWELAEIPDPSLVVGSGHGVHAYWLLDHDLTADQQREELVYLLPRFYAKFGGDHVQNLSRLMRPPGTLNYKDARNGNPPRPCLLAHDEVGHRYRLEDFRRWTVSDDAVTLHGKSQFPPGPSDSPVSRTVVSDSADVASLTARLDLPSHDRSRRDFAIICDLLRLGLSTAEIWEIVAHKSKFETGGRAYFDVTIANAEQAVQSNKFPLVQTPTRT